MSDFISLNKLEETDLFKSMTYQEQVGVRSEWANKYLGLVPGFNALAGNERQMVAHQLITAPPKFKEEGSEVVAWAKSLAERVSRGDREAIEQAKRRVMVTESTRTSLVGNIIAGITSTIEGGKDYNTTYGLDGQKINTMLTQALRSSPVMTAQEMANFEGATKGAALAVNLVEGVVTSMGIVGNLGKAGLLTKGLMGPGGRVATFAAGLKHGVGQKAVAELGEQAVQSIIMGAFSTAENAAIMKFQDPQQRMSTTDAAKYLGSEVLFDWVAWAVLSPAMVVSKAIITSVTGFGKQTNPIKDAISKNGPEYMVSKMTDIATGKHWDEAFMQSLRTVSPASYDELLVVHNGSKARENAIKTGLDTPEKRAIASSYSAGYILTTKPDHIELVSATNPLTPYKFASYDEAVRYAVANSSIQQSNITNGAAQDVTFSRIIETKFNPKTQYSAPQLRKILTPENGLILPENAKFFVMNTLYSSGVAADVGAYIKKAEIKVDNDLFKKANVKADVAAQRITLPAVVDSVGLEKRVRDYLYNYARELGEIEPNAKVKEAIQRRIDLVEKEIQQSFLIQPGSLEGAKHVAKQYLNLDVKISRNGKIQIGSDVFDTPEAAYQFMYAKLIKAGKISADETQQIIKHVSGYSLKLEHDKALGTNMYVLYRPDGQGYIARDTDLAHMIETTPVLNSAFTRMKFPGELAPATFMVSAETGAARLQNDIVVGSITSISEFADGFWDIKRTRKGGLKFVDSIDDKAVALDVNNAIYRITDPDTGIEREFKSIGEARSYIKTELKTWTEMKHEFDRRGYKTYRGPNGILQTFDLDGTQRDFATIESVQEFLKNHPIAGRNTNIFQGDMEAEEKLFLENASVVDQSLTVGKVRQVVNSVLNSKTISRFLFPTEVNLEDVLKKTGNPALLNVFRNFNASMRVVNAKNAQYGVIIDGLWKDVPHKYYKAITYMLDLPETEWDKVLKAEKLEMTPKLKEFVDKAKAFYKEIDTEYGISDGKTLFYYAPRITDYLQQMLKDGKEPPTSTPEMLKAIFGEHIPAKLSFFAQTVRRDVFLDVMNDLNPYRTMQIYVNQMNKKAFIGNNLQHLNGLVNALSKEADSGKIAKADLEFLKDSIMETFGVKTLGNKTMQEASIRLTTNLYNKMTKVLAKSSAFKDYDLAKAIVTDDIIGKFSFGFTFSTQAFRMWVIPRNLTQVSLLSAIVGNKKAWDAFAYVVNHPEYVDNLAKKGLFSENLYHGHDLKNSPSKTLIDMALNPLEHSDMITRATAYRVSEMAFNDAIPRYRKGIIDKKQLLDELDADILDSEMQKRILNMVDTGDDLGAMDMMGEKFNNMTMFNYGKGQQGLAFRGLPGRLWGKLGVYPMGALALYKTILSRGSVAKVATRAVRLAATSSALYWAFNAIGIDYQGFLWTDPFEFSGGPFWSLLTDFSASMGSGNDSAMARAKLKNSVARMAVPAAFRYWYDGAKFASEGRTLEALLSFSTAPMNKELKEYGSFDSTGFGK